MQRFGPYLAVEKIGQGGMAQVFRGTAQDGRSVVIKVPLSRDEVAADRLRDEARAGLRLSHPALVETYDLVESPDGPALIAGFIDGVMLSKLWRIDGALSPPEVAHLGARLTDGLRALHSARDAEGRPLNIIHRDVTATNVIIDRRGDPRIIDLGIARSESNQHTTDLDVVRGTARYLSPEVVMGETSSQADDVWALGCTLLEAALGAPVIDGDKAMVVLRTVVERNPLTGREAELPPDLLAIFKRVFTSAQERIDAHQLAQAFAALDAAGGAKRLAERVGRIAPRPAQDEADAFFERGGPAPMTGVVDDGIEPLPGGGRDLSAFDFSEVDREQASKAPVAPMIKAGPVPSGEMELDLESKDRSREARERARTGAVDASTIYPDTSPPGRSRAVPALVIVIVVGALAGGAFLFRDKLFAPAPRPELTEVERAAVKIRAEELHSAVPDCWDPNKDMWFVYTGPKGEDVVVESLSRVPNKLRKQARCIRPVR